MRWFGDCSSLDQVKGLYKKLAKEFHPDLGGDTATMQEINREFSFCSAKILAGGDLSGEKQEDEIRFSEGYRVAIERICMLEGLVIELVGHWIWVSGSTRVHKDSLKSAGFFFAPKKIAWYFRTDEFRVKRGGKKSLEEIRAKYGSEVVSGFKGRPYLNA